MTAATRIGLVVSLSVFLSAILAGQSILPHPSAGTTPQMPPTTAAPPPGTLSGQGISPYPLARTDRRIQPKTPMAPPPVNTVFVDADFGESLVRATDGYTDPEHSNVFFRSAADGDLNEWSRDGRKSWVVEEGGAVLPFSFDPSTMSVSRLPDPKHGPAAGAPLEGRRLVQLC